ncbi:MAG: LysM peptidoglycan-binding domain-containing protein, partial [Kangiellaceae bacterium]|nr:LysM peptidoglycan-binding domain-containing protein [Kangiellaceae bacterium]
MIRTFIKITLAICLGLILSACQVLDGSRKDQAKVADLSMQAKSNQDRQVIRAVRFLETGKQQDAKQLLKEVLLFNPKHDKAILLNRQLSEPSEAFFGTDKSLSYSIKPGDSLGKIAHKWLGESLYFVGLAKLNNITNPSRLEPGKKIKIPLVGPAVTIQKQGRRSRANLALLKQYRNNQDFSTGLKKANTLFVLDKDLQSLLHEQQLILDTYAGQSNTTKQRRQMLESVTKIAESSRNKNQLGVYQRFIKAQ